MPSLGFSTRVAPCATATSASCGEREFGAVTPGVLVLAWGTAVQPRPAPAVAVDETSNPTADIAPTAAMERLLIMFPPGTGRTTRPSCPYPRSPAVRTRDDEMTTTGRPRERTTTGPSW